jgi:hypothetical protein
MRQHQSPPQSGGEVQSHRTHGNAGAHLSQEVRSGAVVHVTVMEPILAGGSVQSCRAHGSAWAHALLLVLS